MAKVVTVIGVVLFWFLVTVISAEETYKDVVIKTVDRNIDLSTQISRHKLTIIAENSGSISRFQFILTIENELDEHLAVLDVFNSSGKALNVTKIENKEYKTKGFGMYLVNLEKGWNAHSNLELRVSMIFTHTLLPYPVAIKQHEKQFVVYNDNHYFFSPYPVMSQTTTIKLSSSSIESVSELQPTKIRAETITFGPYLDVKSFSRSPLRVHFENNTPFITITSLVKEIEISHWGNVAIEETYSLQHDGAKLKEFFSRFDYQRNPLASVAHIPMFKELLPAGARDIYYRDDIGNISTSQYYYNLERNGVVLDMRPRYPLFGGWKAQFYLGYNLPLHYFLFNDAHDSSIYMLNISFAVTFDFAVIDHLIVRVILPEGARDPERYVPFPLDGESMSVVFTYLDVNGRRVIILEKKNVVSEMNLPFQITYRFSKLSLLHEPLLLVISYFILFLFVMLYTRLEFSIGEFKNVVPKIDSFPEGFKKIMETRFNAHADFEKILASSEAQKIIEGKKKMDNILQACSLEADNISKQLLQLKFPEVNLVQHIEKLEKEKSEIQNKLFQLEIEKNNKKGKGSSKNPDRKTSLEEQYHNLCDEIEELVDNL